MRETGIYQALKMHLREDEWRSFLDSMDAKWLPKPDCTYGDGYLSFFTETGFAKFRETTLDRFMHALDPERVVIRKYDITDPQCIVYIDEYQVVMNGAGGVRQVDDQQDDIFTPLYVRVTYLMD